MATGLALTLFAAFCVLQIVVRNPHDFRVTQSTAR